MNGSKKEGGKEDKLESIQEREVGNSEGEENEVPSVWKFPILLKRIEFFWLLQVKDSF